MTTIRERQEGLERVHCQVTACHSALEHMGYQEDDEALRLLVEVRDNLTDKLAELGQD